VTTITAPTPELAARIRTRRAENALNELANELRIMQHKLANGTAEADDARKSGELMAVIAGHLGALEALRDITGAS
jgi:hypothetical protein